MFAKIPLILISSTLLLALPACKNDQGTQSQENTEQTTQPVQLLDAQASQKLLKEKPEITILDVRTPAEFADGHLEKAENLDFHADFAKKISGLDKNKPYLVYCQRGKRSAEAVDAMKAAGFSQVYDMDGGYSAWSGQNLPTVK